jgi:hypothetical protein
MMNTSKTVGYILLGIGAVLLLAVIAWAISYPFEQASTRLFPILAALIVCAPLIGLGIYTLTKGTAESAEMKVIKKQQELLNLVMTQGKVNLATAAVAMNATRDEVKAMVYDLIGKKLFSGYVDWDGQMLYSSDAAKLKGDKCPKCGGELEIAGKGLIKCPYCGAEIFLN